MKPLEMKLQFNEQEITCKKKKCCKKFKKKGVFCKKCPKVSGLD